MLETPIPAAAIRTDLILTPGRENGDEVVEAIANHRKKLEHLALVATIGCFDDNQVTTKLDESTRLGVMEASELFIQGLED